MYLLLWQFQARQTSNLNCRSLCNEVPEGFTVFNVEPDSLNARRKLRTTNMVECQNKELKKRTRCIRVFPNKESLLRIATALLIELDEKWLANGKVYLKGWRLRFGEFTEKTLRSPTQKAFVRLNTLRSAQFFPKCICFCNSPMQQLLRRKLSGKRPRFSSAAWTDTEPQNLFFVFFENFVCIFFKHQYIKRHRQGCCPMV